MTIVRHKFMPLGITETLKKMLSQFNSESLFDLIRQQCSNPNSLIQKIKECNIGFWESKKYFHCLNISSNDIDLGVTDTILLTRDINSYIAIDICKNGNIAGFEYIDQN